MSDTCNQSTYNVEVKNIPEELRNSAEKILNYSDISNERAELFRVNLERFRNLSDKFSIDRETRKIKEAVNSVFFEIYTSVLKKVLAGNNCPRLYQMFLIYAYMDDKLLQPEQINTLYELLDKSALNATNSMYNLKTWLENIWNQQKDPSINEFGQDYYEVFREKKRRGEVYDKDKPEYDNDADGKLEHEINNLFKMGQRLCCGQMSAYFPILYSEMITRDLEKTLVTPEKIRESLNKVQRVDFSAFHREIVYNQPEKGISKELIMKSVLPEFILMPTFGVRAVMWQELTGRVRTSPGRFIFPIFTDEDLDNLMEEVIARFRWDLSKTMFSYARNNEQLKSLTADYSNYLQFYKKNVDLSNETKEKIKAQIAKYRNNVGDMFVSDYHTWINYESKGLVRLNKVAREIFLKYCPFSKPIRESLEKHPLYNQQITRFNGLRNKQARAIEAHYSKLVKPGVPLDSELMRNLIFYKM